MNYRKHTKPHERLYATDANSSMEPPLRSLMSNLAKRLARSTNDLGLGILHLEILSASERLVEPRKGSGRLWRRSGNQTLRRGLAS